MDTENRHPHNPAPRPHRPGMSPQPGRPMGRQPAMDGFAVRRPNPAAPVPSRPATHIPVNTRPAAAPVPRPHTPQHPAPRPASPAAPRAHTPVPLQREFVPEITDDLDAPKGAKPPKERDNTGHSGLVGFLVFVLLGALLVSPFIPGKILQDFPLSSSNFSTGDQALACLDNFGTVTAKTTYDNKAGAPLNYRYATSTTQSAECNGKTETAVTGHTSQFSPLALVVDIAVALAVAIIAAKIWRRIFGEKRERR